MPRNFEEKALLLAQAGSLYGQRWPLSKDITLGRDPDCDIIISDRQVSRQHACIQLTSDGIQLVDLHSKNGTHCNGKKISDPVLLKDGDSIQIALAQNFLFLSSDATLPLDVADIESQITSQGSEQIFPDERVLQLDNKSRRVWITISEEGKNHKVEITPPLSAAQYRLLEELYKNQGKVISRYDLITAVWGENQALDVSIQALDALIRRLRERLSDVDPTHEFIITVRGHGLRLDNPTLTPID